MTVEIKKSFIALILRMKMRRLMFIEDILMIIPKNLQISGIDPNSSLL